MADARTTSGDTVRLDARPEPIALDLARTAVAIVDAASAPAPTPRVLAAARRAGLRVVYSGATPAADLPPELAPQPGDLRGALPSGEVRQLVVVGRARDLPEAATRDCECVLLQDCADAGGSDLGRVSTSSAFFEALAEPSFGQRILRAVRESVAIVPYDPGWPDAFRREREHLRACLPRELVGRIEHFGSTAVPGLAAKPVIDILVEVFDLEATRARIAPLLEAQGYDYFWRPSDGDDVPPFYAWFIKRDSRTGVRTHHIHMVEPHFEHWDRLLFRDHLRAHPEAAAAYARLKRELAGDSAVDRVAYTRGKTEFVRALTEQARRGRGAPA